MIEQLSNFLHEENDESRISMINFLYGGKKNHCIKSLQDFSINRLIGSQSESVISEYSLEIKKVKKEFDKKTKTRILNNLIKKYFKEWILLTADIHKKYFEYIEKLLDENEFDYLIVSEAPLLSIPQRKKAKLTCNYIFGEDNESTIYRSTPYHALKKMDDNNYSSSSTSISKNDFQDLMKNKKVIFIDLIPMPLPSIPTKVRRDWSFDPDFQIEKDIPLTFTLFRLAFEWVDNYFKAKEKKINFSDNAKIVFMMPPKTSMGIIDFLAKDPTSGYNLLPDPLKHIAKVIYRTNHYSAKNNNEALKELPLRQFRQLAVNYSNNPCIETFLHSIKNDDLL
jgi:hypothetical protein